MLHRLSIVLVVLASLIVGSYSEPSQTPSCFICPAEDSEGFPLGESNTVSDPIFCSYPAVPGEDPTDFFCNYSKTTGTLTLDNDAGLCPATAVSTCQTRKRRDALPKSPRPRSPEAGARPKIMRVREKLGRAKRQA